MTLIKIFEEKKRCFEKLLEHSSEFVKVAVDLDGYESFLKKRNVFITTIKFYNKLINKNLESFPHAEKTEFMIKSLSKLIQDESELIYTILDTNQKIILKLENEKLKIDEELKNSEKILKNIGRFKSSWVLESGSKLDGIL